MRHHQSGRRGRQCEPQAFRHQLPHQAAAARPQRRSDRHFFLPLANPRQQQMGHIGAGRQQHKHHHSEKHQRGFANIARKSLPQRLKLDFPEIFGRDRKIGRGSHVSAVAAIRLSQLNPRTQAADRVDGDAAVPREPAEVEHGGCPDRGFAGKIHGGRRYSHHRHRYAVQMDGRAENARVAAERLLPQPVAQHGHAIAALQILADGETSSERRNGPEHGKEVGGRLRYLDTGRSFALGAQCHFLRAINCGVREIAGVLAPAFDLIPVAADAEFAERDDSAGVAERQAAQQPGVQHAEDAGGGADGQCQRGQSEAARNHAPPVYAGGMGNVAVQLPPSFIEPHQCSHPA